MSTQFRLLLKSVVKSFYRENAGSFVFFFVVMFGVVGQLNAASVWAYHYALIIGMLKNREFYLLIVAVWFLYARKCSAYVVASLKLPEYEFLQILTRMGKRKIRALFFWVQCSLYLPVLLYSALVVGVAFYHHMFIQAAGVIVFHSFVCFGGARLILHHLYDPEKKYDSGSMPLPAWLGSSYLGFLYRFLFNEAKMIIAGIKVFTCAVLYFLTLSNSGDSYDIQLPFLFFSFGVFANGIVVHRLRSFEETQLSFYRGLPVARAKRFLKASLFYLIFFIPELITIGLLMPAHLHYEDAVLFALCGVCLLMLLNSISLIAFFEMKAYLRIVLLVYALLYLFVATLSFYSLAVVLLLLSAALFFLFYYHYEHVES